MALGDQKPKERMEQERRENESIIEMIKRIGMGEVREKGEK